MQDTKFNEMTSGCFDDSFSYSNFFHSLFKIDYFKNVHSDVRATYSRSYVVNLLILLKVYNINSINSFFCSTYKNAIGLGKDVIYSVKNSAKNNWRLLLLNQSIKCINDMEIANKNATMPSLVPCFIADDTDISKTGKCMEFVGKIFSHVGLKYNFGYKTLLLSYWSGKTLINLDFTTHVESRKNGMQGLSKKQFKNRFSKIRNDKTPGATRQKECFIKKTDALISMLKRVLNRKLEVRYLLVDSWFFNSSLVEFIKGSPIDLICRPKQNNWKYKHKNKYYTIGQLINKYKGKKYRKNSTKLKMYTVTLDVNFKGVNLKLFLYKTKKRGSKWQVIISTHKSLSAIMAYGIYKNRWAIEVAFKEMKQHMQFGKCQSRDFDAQIADQTTSLILYNYLSTFKTINCHQSIGLLFNEIKDRNIMPTVMDKFWSIVNEIAAKIEKLFGIEIDEILDLFLNDSEIIQIFNPNYFKMTTET